MSCGVALGSDRLEGQGAPVKESLTMRYRFLGFLMILVFGISSCGVSDLSKEPLWSNKVIHDLLARAKHEGKRDPAKASRFEVVLLPGKNQVLRVSGRIRGHDEGSKQSIGPTDFVVEINGQSVARKQLRSPDSHASFEYVIDLENYVGQKVTATFFQKNHDPGGTEAGWKRISLESRRRVRRRTAAEGPNVLFLMVDTVRADHCSLYGYERQTTPNLDRLAARSLVFDRAISPAAWTLPSVASMLTGKYSIKMRAVDGVGLRKRDVMLAELLLDEGFTTMAVSTNPLIGPNHAFDQGFETFIQKPWERAATVNRHFSKWLKTAVSTQWFAYLHYIDPHDPYEAPSPFLGHFSDSSYKGPFLRNKALNEIANTVNYGLKAPFTVDESDLGFLRDRYDEEIRYWDSTLGQLLEDLERNNVLDRTLIVVVSDHGEEFADHGKYKHGKHLYQETVHVPLLVSFPGSKLVGRRTDAVETRLLMSSLLGYFGVAKPAGIRGDLFEKDMITDRAVSYSRYTVKPDDPHGRMGLVAQIRGQWKMISETDREGDLLFNLALDPPEKDDRSAVDPDAHRENRLALEVWLKSHPRPKGARPAISDDTLEALRALGYVQ